MSRRLVLSAVVAVTLLGQAVALLYEIVVAASFGTGRGADALALALGLALVIANEVGTWVPILFQPEYIEARTTAGDSQAAAFFVRTATLLTGIGAAIAILLIVTAPGLLSLVAGGAGPARDAVPLLRWLAPIVVLGPLSALLTALLQAHGRFTLPALRQVCWYVVAVGIVAALASRIGPLAVPLGLLAGLALFCVVLMAALPAGTIAALPSGTMAITAMRDDSRLTRLVIAAMPLVLASCANYVNLGMERAMAARLGPGARLVRSKSGRDGWRSGPRARLSGAARNSSDGRDRHRGGGAQSRAHAARHDAHRVPRPAAGHLDQHRDAFRDHAGGRRPALARARPRRDPCRWRAGRSRGSGRARRRPGGGRSGSRWRRRHPDRGRHVRPSGVRRRAHARLTRRRAPGARFRGALARAASPGERVMRILICATSSMPDAIGGSDRVVWQLSRGLAVRGHDVQLVIRRLAPDLPATSIIDGVTIHRYADPWHTFATLYMPSVACAVRALRAAAHDRTPHVVHAHHGLSGLAAARAAIGPPMYTFYGPWHQEFLHEVQHRTEMPSLKRWTRRLWAPAKAALARRIERAAVRHARRVVVLSRYSQSQLAEVHAVSGARVSIVPGGVDLQQFVPRLERREARSRLGLAGEGRLPL